MTSWYRLSPELRNMILGTVAECHSYRTEPKALSGYASVSREWNCFFETTNFQRVSLDRGRAQDFDKMFSGENTRRRGYLKYLQVLFVFEEYDCSSCATPEDDATRKRNQKSLTETLWSVLRTLSKWEESGRGQQDKQQPDLEMELGAYSPSDSKHFFRDFRLERTYPYRVENDLDETFEGYSSWMQSKPMVDEFHGWSANGERQRPPPDGAKRRLLGRAPLLQDFHGFDRRRKRSFPRVQAVTSLVITRRFYRNFDPRLLGNLIKNCFPRLRHFRHEWWYSVDLELQHRYEDRYACFLLPHLPPTLQELHLCQESSFTLHQDVDVKLSRATKRLRKASRNLVHLSASNIVSGAYFLGVGDSAFDFGVDEGWPNLQTLSLSTSYIVPKKRGWDNLLVGAARAALLMPELKVMELWGVYDGEGAIFCYNAHGKEAPLMRLTSTDTQRCRIRGEPPSFELWKKVARRHGRGELVIETRFLEMARLSTGHNFASETFLKHRILSRLSLHQRLWESRHPSNC